MVREHPEPLLHCPVLGGVGLEDRGEHAALDPSGIELRVSALHALRLHVAAYVVAPVAVADVGGGSREPRQVAEHLPGCIGITREADLIAVASDSSPSVIDYGTAGVDALALALAHHVIEEGVVQPECIAQIRNIFAELPLLPVKPPEIYSLTLERTDNGIEICISPGLVVNPERNRGLAAVLLYVALRPIIVRSP